MGFEKSGCMVWDNDEVIQIRMSLVHGSWTTEIHSLRGIQTSSKPIFGLDWCHAKDKEGARGIEGRICRVRYHQISELFPGAIITNACGLHQGFGILDIAYYVEKVAESRLNSTKLPGHAKQELKPINIEAVTTRRPLPIQQ
ncbi:hypothetical protein EV2_000030 [Malus domestica]